MEYKIIFKNDNTLCHYGTKGQKWGVRNYQNEDGSLTEEGRKRYKDRVRSTTEFKENTPKTYSIEDAVSVYETSKAKYDSLSPIEKQEHNYKSKQIEKIYTKAGNGRTDYNTTRKNIRENNPLYYERLETEAELNATYQLVFDAMASGKIDDIENDKAFAKDVKGFLKSKQFSNKFTKTKSSDNFLFIVKNTITKTIKSIGKEVHNGANYVKKLLDNL